MKLLLIDIENSPNLSWHWDARADYINYKMMVKPKEMISFAAKWYKEDYSYYYDIRNKEEMLAAASEMMSSADAIVHFNGLQHDIPILNTELARAGLAVPPEAKQIDLMRTVKNRFKLYSNSLAYTCKYFGLPTKSESGDMSQIWLSLHFPDLVTKKALAKAWKDVEEYNRNDTEIMEPLYEFLRPWIKNHPNLNLWTFADGCPTCGGLSLQKRGFHFTRVSIFQRYRCNDCGAWSMEGKREMGVNVR